MCMKCGSKTTDTQVFCDHCLMEMSHYPVKPDIRIQLPVRQPSQKKTQPKKPPVRPEVEIARLRRQIKGLFLALVCAILALALAIGLLFRTSTQKPAEDTVGKNYSTSGTDSHQP